MPTSDPTTWTDLKATLANWLARDDLSATEIPEAIALFERRAQRTIFSPEREATSALTLDAEAVALPADLWGIRALYIDADPKTVLEPMTLAELRTAFAAAATGRPANYAIRGEQLVLGPAPDASYTARLTYIQAIPALGSGQATNWLLTDHPDGYVHGALAELHLLLGDEERAAIHERVLQRIVAEIDASAVRRSAGGAPIRVRSPVSV